jgi:hypothetical protein
MFLKREALNDGPVNFMYHGHVGPQTKQKRAGGTYDVYSFDLETTSNSERNLYDISPKSVEIGGLLDAEKGDTVQAFPNGEWVNWKLIPRQSEPTDYVPPSSGSKEQVTSANTLKDVNQSQEEKSIAISLQGYAQSYSTGILASNLEISDEDLKNGAIDFAADMRERTLKKAREIYISQPKQ